MKVFFILSLGLIASLSAFSAKDYKQPQADGIQTAEELDKRLELVHTLMTRRHEQRSLRFNR